MRRAPDGSPVCRRHHRFTEVLGFLKQEGSDFSNQEAQALRRDGFVTANDVGILFQANPTSVLADAINSVDDT